MTSDKLKNGNLLIAEPSIIGDLSFNRSVILLADHNDEGSVGFILNKPLKYTIQDLVPEIHAGLKIYNGGPVEQDSLYFIHNVPESIPNSVGRSKGEIIVSCTSIFSIFLAIDNICLRITPFKQPSETEGVIKVLPFNIKILPCKASTTFLLSFNSKQLS